MNGLELLIVFAVLIFADIWLWNENRKEKLCESQEDEPGVEEKDEYIRRIEVARKLILEKGWTAEDVSEFLGLVLDELLK